MQLLSQPYKQRWLSGVLSLPSPPSHVHSYSQRKKKKKEPLINKTSFFICQDLSITEDEVLRTRKVRKQCPPPPQHSIQLF